MAPSVIVCGANSKPGLQGFRDWYDNNLFWSHYSDGQPNELNARLHRAPIRGHSLGRAPFFYVPVTPTFPGIMDALIKSHIIYLSTGVEACAALIIALAATQATFHAMRLFFVRPPHPEQRKVEVRLRLGRWLSLALEFLLAADILRTAVAPTWDEIGKLAAIVVLRTLLNYFLDKEIRSAENKEAPASA